MNQPTHTGTDEYNQDTPDDSQGFDSVLQTIEGYIQDPTTVTRQTLSQLKADVMDLKDYFEGSQEQANPSEESASQTGMSEMMNKARGQ